jgi:hypothetical protein
MMKQKPIKHHMDGLLVLLLFGVFAACILSVLLTGASTYRKLTDRDQAVYDDRTAIQYIATKVRQADQAGAVSVETFQGVPTLVLTEDVAGEACRTRIYYFNGYLRELFSAADAEMSPEDGEAILEAKSLQVEDAGGRLELRLLTESGWRNVTLALRSGEGALS